MAAIRFGQFMKLADFFFASIGIEPYTDPAEKSPQRNLLKKQLLFSTHILNMNYVMISEVVLIVMAAWQQTNFKEATMTLIYVGFVSAGDLKMLTIWNKKPQLSQFIADLYQLFPGNLKEQSEHQMTRYLRQCTLITTGFSMLYMFLIWTYNLFSMLDYIIMDYALNIRTVQPTLPYYMYIPWEWQNHWSFYVLFVSQIFAGYTSAAGQISSDLLLCSTASQMVMHYDYLRRSLESYKVKFDQKKRLSDKKEDIQYLSHIIAYHDKVIR